ncbi:growth hormone releasing hormone, isoform CRA_a [Rattus norvegicus]|uniref:Somatoliberin n=2 Tax=Rattus norvegicus TaxID=10116 RepID=A6JWS2_RAT|nr:pre-progrowth hormone releasing factor [Rattus norvegicus]EDL96685.1 growth hormone releasing hormone, isoform CRA_a [Rattus norvegicus]EDL96688.1 growth hormone releasing hormone, isoform CRA_a [Rattus norvegicus]
MPLWVFFVLLTLTSGSHCSLPPSPPFRVRRHADAIFTSSYRRILGQLYARKLLHEIMNRQQGERNQEQRSRFNRHLDRVWAEDKQMALESILVQQRSVPRYLLDILVETHPNSSAAQCLLPLYTLLHSNQHIKEHTTQ